MENSKTVRERIQKSKDIKKVNLSDLPSIPKDMLIETGNICNHKCIFCANSKITSKRGQIDIETVSRILKEGRGIGLSEVGFSAKGEPFLNKEILDFIKKAKDLKYKHVYVTTNGSLVDEKIAEKLVDTGIDSVKFSINAGCRESYKYIHGKDDFEKVIKNLINLDKVRKRKEKNMSLTVSCILTSETKNEKEMLKEIIGLYVDDIIFSNAHNQGGMMNENIEKGITEIEEVIVKPCSEVFNRINITHEGYVTACCVDYQNYLVIADTKDVSLKEAWSSDVFRELRNRHIKGETRGCLCGNCLYKVNENIDPINKKYATLFDLKNFKKDN